MSAIAAAVVGTGFIGPVHVEALRRAGIRTVGIFDCDRSRAERVAQQLGVAKTYGSYDDVLADETVHSVHIATPNRWHHEMARAALRAGKHVMCEKPLATGSSQSAALVELARKATVAAGVNYNMRFYPLCQEAAERVRSGRVGDVYHVTGSYVQDWLCRRTDYNWRVLEEEGGPLRAVADIGTHWLDLIGAITGLEVESVCADLKTFFPVRQRPRGDVETFRGKGGAPSGTEPVQITTDDYGCVMLCFRGGARGCLWVSQVLAGRKNCLRFEIAGSKQSLAWNSERPNTLWIGHRERANEHLIRDPALLTPAAARFAECPGGHNEGFPDTFKQCFRAFYQYIEAGDFTAPPTFPTFADGHREVVLCEAILRSHREGKWINVR